MAMVTGDWTITRSTGAIRYIGDDHGGGALITAGAFVTGTNYEIRTIGSTDFTLIGAASNTIGVRFAATGAGTGTGEAKEAASYATVLEFHRWLQDFADQEISSGDDEHDITDPTSSDRSTDNIITLQTAGSIVYNIDFGASQHLYDGSIIQKAGSEIYDGVVNFGNGEVVIQVLKDGAVVTDDFWNYNIAGTHTGAADATVLTDAAQSFVVDEHAGRVIINTTDGSHGRILSNTATTVTLTASGLHGGTDNDFDASDAYLIAEGLNANAGNGISHRFMVLTREDGVDLDGRRLIGTARTFSRTFAEFSINGTARGNNVLALTDADDLNNATVIATVAGWSNITNTEGLRLLDISGDSVNEEYYSEWNRDTQTINDFYERLKYLSRDNSAATLQGQNGELWRGLTHSFAYTGEVGTPATTNDELVWGTAIAFDGAVGTFTVGEAIHEDTATPVWKGRIIAIDDNVGTGTLIVDVEEGTVLDPSSFTGQGSAATADVNVTPTAVTGGGTMVVGAYDDDGTVGNVYVQVNRGTAPAAAATLYNAATSTAAIDVANVIVVSGAPTSRTISSPFHGASTGSALIGAYGIGMEAADTSASDKFTDLSGTLVTPPNNVTFTVLGLVIGEDRVLVTNNNATAPDFTQMTLATGLTAGGITNINVQAAEIPDDTPSPSGVLRVTLDDGRKRRIAYTAVPDTSNFTTASTSWVDPDDAAISNGVMIAYIDLLATAVEESFTTVFDATRTLFIRARDGGASPIKTFEGTGILSSTGGSITIIRTPDV